MKRLAAILMSATLLAQAASVATSGAASAETSSQTSRSTGVFGRLEVILSGAGRLSTLASDHRLLVTLASPTGIGRATLKGKLVKGTTLTLFLPSRELEGLEISCGGVAVQASAKHSGQEWCEAGKPSAALSLGDLRRLRVSRVRRDGIEGFEVEIPPIFLDKLSAGADLRIQWVDYYR